MQIHDLRPAKGATHKIKRLGRGEASGKGGTSTKGNKGGQSKMVGAAIAQKSTELGIKNVVFDRSGYIYHGRVRAVAEGAREGGLVF